jgi:hypothetical protein
MTRRVGPNPEPWSFVEAVAAARRASEAQQQAEQARRDAASDLAEKERIYRQALAAEVLKAHADGAAWTVAQDLARGNKHVSQLRYERDVQRGVVEAAEQRAWRHQSDRRDTREFITWSRLINSHGEQAEPADLPEPIGARRAT